MVRYGVAGLKDPKDLEGSIAKVVEGGYAACESSSSRSSP